MRTRQALGQLTDHSDRAPALPAGLARGSDRQAGGNRRAAEARLRKKYAYCRVKNQCSRKTAESMPQCGENIRPRPSRRDRARRACRQEPEARTRPAPAALARQHLVEPCAQRMEMQDVGGGIFELRRGQLGRAPVRGLLLLRESTSEQVAHQILEPVPVGEGAGAAWRRSWCSRPAAARRRDSA